MRKGICVLLLMGLVIFTVGCSLEPGGAADRQIATSECQKVFLACGTCSDDRAKVEVYCGSGGAEPDYYYCEPC